MNEKHLISEEIQTDIYGFQLENLQSFQDTLLSNKLNLNVKLKQIEDMLETGLFKKNEVIEKLNSEIASMRIISEETNAMQKVMTDHVGLTLQEIQKDIKNLEKNIEKQSIIEDVQVELAQTNKKLMDVKRKCMKTSRQCLLMQFESVSMLCDLKL
ncbi:CLUMA_CG006348, isoform A [Clunio marinus]|uniref:CLUMA_CG006348, isoform A n=1 Tax=Clunio marinus TaxID=568069 RepID=A0A1J1HYU4_9DIPT|nr:CLUMA_CG006348, isoform A [Clunio marinus]